MIRGSILDGGICSGLNWYISQIQNNDLEDNLSACNRFILRMPIISLHVVDIPETAWKIQKPSFFAAALKDCICTPIRGRPTMKQFGTDVTTVDFNTGHWVHLEESDRLNDELEAWLVSLTSL